MITQPENNITLSESQTLAIEETKTRLLNLESEISIATKNQKSLRIENEKLVKDNIYQAELLVATEANISKLQSELSTLEASISTKREELQQLAEEITRKTQDLEKSVNEGNATLREQQAEFNTKVASFDEKVARLKEVIPTL
jgi:chromosome segregation ATPase